MRRRKKRKNKLLLLLTLIILLSSVGTALYYIYGKVEHEKEREVLLEAKDMALDISINNNDKDNDNDNSKSKDLNKDNKPKEDKVNREISVNSEKKVTKGRDFITEAKKRSSQNVDAVNVSLDQQGTIRNDDNFMLLARLINSESGNEPYTGKIAVGNVVLYRSRLEGENLQNIIYQKNQFDGVNTSNFNIEPSEESKRAALEVLQGKEAISNGYYFANLKLCNPSWAKEDNFICRIGDHWFFRK